MAIPDPKKLKALALAAEGLNPSQIAEKLGVSQRSVYRWLKDCPDLTEFVKSSHQESLAESLGRVRAKAVQLTERLLDKALEEVDELSISRPIPVLPIACKISGLENPELLVESQLDELEKLLPPEHYASLLQALESLSQSREESTRTVRK